MRRLLQLAVVGVTARVLSAAAAPAPGDVDRGFGADGRVVTTIGPAWARASAVVLQADGKIVVAGARGVTLLADFALAGTAPTERSIRPSATAGRS